MRRRLHRARAVARVEHLAKEPLQVDRLGRRALDAAALAADARLDRADQAGPPAGRGEDREEQKRRRRLAVRPGYADDLRAPRVGSAEELVGRRRHRGARVGDDELRHVDVEPPLDDEGDRAALDRLACEIVPVGVRAADAEEQRAGADRARVVREIGHLDRSAPDDVDRPERGGEALEIRHRPASLPPPSGGSAS